MYLEVHQGVLAGRPRDAHKFSNVRVHGGVIPRVVCKVMSRDEWSTRKEFSEKWIMCQK